MSLPAMILTLMTAASITGSTAAAQTQSEPKPIWSLLKTDEGASLMFAVPQSDDLAFFLLCNNKSKRVDLTVYEAMETVQVGSPITIEMAAGDQNSIVKGRAATDEMMGFVYGQARRIAPAPVLAVPRAKGELTVKMGASSANYPEAGRAAAVAGFVRNCRVK